MKVQAKQLYQQIGNLNPSEVATNLRSLADSMENQERVKLGHCHEILSRTFGYHSKNHIPSSPRLDLEKEYQELISNLKYSAKFIQLSTNPNDRKGIAMDYLGKTIIAYPTLQELEFVVTTDIEDHIVYIGPGGFFGLDSNYHNSFDDPSDYTDVDFTDWTFEVNLAESLVCSKKAAIQWIQETGGEKLKHWMEKTLENYPQYSWTNIEKHVDFFSSIMTDCTFFLDQ